MPTANIISIDPNMVGVVPVGVSVTFSCNHGREQRTYYYAGTDAALAIMGGADPAGYDGTEGGAPSDSGISEIEGAIDIGEIGEIGGLLL